MSGARHHKHKLFSNFKCRMSVSRMLNMQSTKSFVRILHQRLLIQGYRVDKWLRIIAHMSVSNNKEKVAGALNASLSCRILEYFTISNDCELNVPDEHPEHVRACVLSTET